MANSLVGVLVALIADVKAMFHQIKADPETKTRSDFHGGTKETYIKKRRFINGGTTLWCNLISKFCLKQTAGKFGYLYPSMISGAVLHNFYVDDCLVSISTVKEAVTMQQKLTELLARHGFHLTEWISNDNKVLESISKLERSNLGQFMLDKGVKEKVLGMQWHIKGDYFTFDMSTKNLSQDEDYFP